MTATPTIAQALARAQSSGLNRHAVRCLVLQALEREPDETAWLLAHDQDALPAAAALRLESALRRLRAGEPLAYITGSVAFYGLRLRVDARVLIPRPDTETLVDWALALLPPAGRVRPSVLDLGTGSGAIALAVRQARPDVRVTGVDASAEALEVACANARRLGLMVDFRLGDWLIGETARYNLIAANPPYIAEGDPHLPGLTHEPLRALTAGDQGLDDLRRIVAQAPGCLQTGGWLVLEHGFDQGPAVRALLDSAPWSQVQTRRDLAGHERCTAAQRAPDGGQSEFTAKK
ncbi:MAG: peptide chain release factor N(5)-glutamine methyltransferase [Rhodoferax sp.]|nr:peptide chain release factor N(5)-glutamine methyltransferase [Rhodoferax sp.]